MQGSIPSVVIPEPHNPKKEALSAKSSTLLPCPPGMVPRTQAARTLQI